MRQKFHPTPQDPTVIFNPTNPSITNGDLQRAGGYLQPMSVPLVRLMLFPRSQGPFHSQPGVLGRVLGPA